jgi:hypothetical protein
MPNELLKKNSLAIALASSDKWCISVLITVVYWKKTILFLSMLSSNYFIFGEAKVKLKYQRN